MKRWLVWVGGSYGRNATTFVETEVLDKPVDSTNIDISNGYNLSKVTDFATLARMFSLKNMLVTY